MAGFPKLKTSRSSAKVGSIPSGSGSINPIMLLLAKNLIGNKEDESDIEDIEGKGGIETSRTIGGRKFEFPESSKFTADAQNSVNNIKAQMLMLDHMESMAAKLKGGRIQGSMLGGRAELSGGSGDTALAKTYMDTLPAAAVGFYRAATGDKGQTSDKDAAERSLPLFWKLNESDDLKPVKFQALKNMLQQRLAQLSPESVNQNPFPFPGNQQQAQQQPQQDDSDPLGIFQ